MNTNCHALPGETEAAVSSIAAACASTGFSPSAAHKGRVGDFGRPGMPGASVIIGHISTVLRSSGVFHADL
jgi:hypothetical protein